MPATSRAEDECDLLVFNIGWTQEIVLLPESGSRFLQQEGIFQCLLTKMCGELQPTDGIETT